MQEEELSDFKKPEAAIRDFPDDLIRLMQQYKPVSNQGLIERLEQISTELNNLRHDFQNREDWFKRFKESLEGLLHGLEKETKERKDTEREFRKDLKRISWSAAATAGAVGSIVAIIIAILILVFQKYPLFH
jgi:predicted nuclease with TOPRIM domain